MNHKEEDLRTNLILAHYSMHLMPLFLIEGCLSIFLKNEVLTKEYFDGKPIAMLPLIDVIKQYAELFHNEHFSQYEMSKKVMLSRVDYFV